MTEPTEPDVPADTTAASESPPDPGNAGPEQWTGGPYDDPDLDAQLAAALDAPNPLDNPNDVPPPPAGDPVPGADPDGRRLGDDALDPGAAVAAADVYVPDPAASASPPARGPGGKFTGKQDPAATVEGGTDG